MAIEKRHSACALNCPDICAYIVHIEEGKVSRIEGDPDHQYTLGRCCPKGYAHVKRMYSEDRLLYPQLKQNDGSFKSVSINSAPTTIMLGESTTLTWSSDNAQSCEIDQGIGAVNLSGSISVSPTETTTYTITATNPGSTSTATVTVIVTYPEPTVSISADNTTINEGECTNLNWATSGLDPGSR